jgi:hypothetical protein
MKIVDAGAARLAGRAVVAAYFDPMVASHTQRLRELREELGPLAVCVCELDDALLPARARAELAAACADVEVVVIGAPEELGAGRIVDERAADLERRAALMRHVGERQQAAKA